MKEPGRQFPGHIAAKLAGPSDSAGQPWEGRTFSSHLIDADDGTADPNYAAAVASLAAGEGPESAVLTALASTRLLIPIVAELAGVSEGREGLDADKEADMALVTLVAPDGRKALPAFSNTESLRRWHPQARPVPVSAARAALSAVSEEAQLMVVDPSGPRTFIVRRPALWALAQRLPWRPSYADSEVDEAIRRAAAGEPAVRDLRCEPGSGICSAKRIVGGAGPELRVLVSLSSGLDRPAVNEVMDRLQTSWASSELIADRVDSLEVRIVTAGDGE